MIGCRFEKLSSALTWRWDCILDTERSSIHIDRANVVGNLSFTGNT